MSRSYIYVKTDTLDKHKVYCFSEVFLTKNHSVRNTNSYKIGDFIPNVGRGFIYHCNLLIIDLFNSVIHVIEHCVYKESIKITKNNFNCLLEKIDFKKYMVLDIYGRELNVYSLNTLRHCLNSYPRTEIFIESYDKSISNISHKKNDAGSGTLVISSLCTDEDGINTLCGGFYGQDIPYSINEDYEILGSDKKDLEEMSFKGLNYISSEIFKVQKEIFESVWLREEGTFYYANKLLHLFEILYNAYCLNINKPFTYYHLDTKKYTHKDRLSKEILETLISLDNELLEDVVFQIFLYIDEEDYLQFIIETLSILMN